MEIYSKIKQSYIDFVTKNQMVRSAALPVLSSFEADGNPRVSKIGGKFPYLPDEVIPTCPICKLAPMMVAQFYVPTLPNFVQDLFPDSLKNSLIVLSICPSCLGSNDKGYNVRAYDESQLDSLIYHEDIGEDWSKPEQNICRTFNFQPNSPQPYDEIDQKRQYFQFVSISDWKITEMVPYACIDEVKTMMIKEGVEINHRLFLVAHEFNISNQISGSSYLGGWPSFCKGDQTPEGYQILFNFCESEAATLEWGNSGTAQLWIGTGQKSGTFRFTCSSY